MRTLCVGAGLLLLAGSAWADDDQDMLVNDARRETVAEAKRTPPSLEMLRHYEGLKHLVSGRLLERSERLPEAMQAYETALRFDPDAVELMRLCIPVQLKLERTVPALRMMREALGRQPNQPDLWLRYVQELLDLQRHEDVLRTVQQAVKAAEFQDHPAFQADLHVARASALDALGKPADAALAYEQALQLIANRERYLADVYSPTAEELPGEQAKLLERLARACQKADHYDAADVAFRKAGEIHPTTDGRLDLNLAEVALAAKKPEEALRHVQTCLARKPQSDEPYRILVAALRQSGKEADVVPMLEKLQSDMPENSAVRLVLAEEYGKKGRTLHAERLYRELLTNAVPVPAACLRYFQLLLREGKGKEALEEYQQLCRTPRQASWARAATLELLGQPDVLKAMLEHHAELEIAATFRMMLLKIALQARLWAPAEGLARQHVAADPKPGEAYLLWCQGLLEERRYADVAEVCQAAIQNERVTQPLIFHIELAKALAMQRHAEDALEAINAAKGLVSPGTTDEHKVLCTELYVLHLLGRHSECVRQGEALLQTDLARSPWARQVRYLLAHAHEALGQYDLCRQLLTNILQQDPNDDEAAAAQARCLLLQNSRLDEAERAIREAIELDYVAQFKRNKVNPVPTSTRPNVSYQATLGAILLRRGKVEEGVALLQSLQSVEVNPDAWSGLCMGDGWAARGNREEAERSWRSALARAERSPMLGVDLQPTLRARLQPTILQTGSLPTVPASSSSPAKP